MELEKQLDWEVRTETAAADFAAQHSKEPDRVLTRVGRKIMETVIPPVLDAGPPVGDWRRERVAAREDGPMFIDLLVAVDEGAEAFEWIGSSSPNRAA